MTDTNAILSALSSMAKSEAPSGPASVRMTDAQFAQCKEAIRAKNYGMNVHPNRFDVNKPYRVAINYRGKFDNFGNFSCPHTAAAVGGIISSAYFGAEKAKVVDYSDDVVENSQEFQAWLADSRNQAIIKMAQSGTCIHEGAELETEEPAFDMSTNPF